MNLYPTRRNPIACPRDLADRHVKTQIGDLAIMLATAIVAHDGPGNDAEVVARLGPELIGDTGHPCVVWSAAWTENWSWAWLLLGALHDEYQHRTGTSHPQRDRVLVLVELMATSSDDEMALRVLGLTDPPNDWPRSKAGKATGIENDHASARQELAWRYAQWTAKARPPQWTNRPRPEWVEAGP